MVWAGPEEFLQVRFQAEGDWTQLVCLVGAGRRGRGREKAATGSGAAAKALGDLPSQASRPKTQWRADSLGLVG